MKRIVSIVLCAGVGLSCGSSGTSDHDAAALHSIKTLAIGPYNATEAALAVYQEIYTPLDTTVFNVLTRSGRFQAIVPHDTMCAGIDVTDRDAPRKLLERVERKGADALLLCTVDIRETSFRSIALHDAAVTLVLIYAKDSTVIMTTTSATNARAAYYSLPDYSRVVHDAAEGAIQQMLKAWGKK
jgi:hypothetical protein